MEYSSSSPFAGNNCDVDGIANPDNLTFMPAYNTLIIGEDTDNHENNMLWAFNLESGELTRILTTPVFAEATSPYWYPNLNGHGYLTAVSQHPYDSKARMGVIGPFPATSQP